MRRRSMLVAGHGLRIVSGTFSGTSKCSTRKSGVILSTPSLPFSLPWNTPVLLRVVDRLRTMNVDQVALVEIIAIAIVKGQL